MKNIIYKHITLLAFIALFFNGYTQDIHFTQFYASPLSLNAAQHGNFEGDYRISANYRGQYFFNGLNGTYKTLSVGYDQPLKIAKKKFGFGGYAFFDETQANETQMLSTVNLNFGLSYHFDINGHNISVGFQPGYIMRSLVNENTWGNDWNNDVGLHLQGNGNGDPSGKANSKANYVNINTGATWSKKIGKITPIAGIQFKHTNFQKGTFGKPDSSMTAQGLNKQISFGTLYNLNSSYYIWPNATFQHSKKAREFVFGSNLGMNLSENKYKIKSVFIGPMFRTNIAKGHALDAVAVIVGARLKKIDVGISYDITMSGLNTAPGMKDAIEISIIYIAPSTLLKKATVPCDRI